MMTVESRHTILTCLFFVLMLIGVILTFWNRTGLDHSIKGSGSSVPSQTNHAPIGQNAQPKTH